jgi:predicted SnoaL-like aldol condensation-catalyzing enzyme
MNPSNPPMRDPKVVVMDFLHTVFNRHEVDEGLARCVGPTYRQHNPGVPDGVEGFRRHFKQAFLDRPQGSLEVKRMFCEGTFVTVHLQWFEYPGDRGSAVMDIFRLENGRIVEHWDVMQPIPQDPANNNTMF